MRVSFALMGCLFASTFAPVFTACGDDDQDPLGSQGGQAGGPASTGGRLATGGQGGGGGSDGGTSPGGQPTEAGGTTGGTLPGPIVGGQAGEEGFGGGGQGSGGLPAKNSCSPNPCQNGASCARQDELALCVCPNGYRGELCELDVDECLTDNGGCGQAECINLTGTYQCGDCNAGYAPDADGECVDIDECVALSRACDPRTDCTNTAGSYTCSACPAGLRGDAKKGCQDIDECLSNPCDELASCTNVFGGYRCGPCPKGYDGDGIDCTDINECDFKAGGCQVGLRECMNTPGSYKCSDCVAGYTEDGPFLCEDENECLLDPNICDGEPGTVCDNLDGTFDCIDPTPDECKNSTDCMLGYECIEAEGAYKCIDINECLTGPCAMGETCVDEEGSYDCVPGGGGGGCNTDSDCQPNELCILHSCAACPAPTPAQCGGSCVDTETDEQHCGFCDNPCAEGISCVAANCQTGKAE